MVNKNVGGRGWIFLPVSVPGKRRVKALLFLWGKKGIMCYKRASGRGELGVTGFRLGGRNDRGKKCGNDTFIKKPEDDGEERGTGMTERGGGNSNKKTPSVGQRGRRIKSEVLNRRIPRWGSGRRF